MIPEEIQARLVAARRAHNQVKHEIEEWAREQGRRGNLVYNDQAPAWGRYAACLEEWVGAVQAFDEWLRS